MICRRKMVNTSILAFVLLFMSACGDHAADGYKPREKPSVSVEELGLSEEHQSGLYRVEMEDVILEIPKNYWVHFRGKEPTRQPDIWVCWLREENRLVVRHEYSCWENNGFGARLQFRAERKISRGYYQSLEDDFKTLSTYKSPAEYILQASSEYPDLQEFYIRRVEKSFSYILKLDYHDHVTERANKQRISCSPGFREAEKQLDTFYNGLCRYGVFISPRVNLRVVFDSRIMHQFKNFEKDVYQHLFSLVVK